MRTAQPPRVPSIDEYRELGLREHIGRLAPKDNRSGGHALSRVTDVPSKSASRGRMPGQNGSGDGDLPYRASDNEDSGAWRYSAAYCVAKRS